MAAINYGTIAVVPKGAWDSNVQYYVANLVTYDGSSYIAHTNPPAGTLPTNGSYWQLSAQGTNKATADAAGVVRPDGETISVDAAGTISAKKATGSTFGIVSGGSKGVSVGSDGVMSVDTAFTQAAQLANIIAAEAFPIVLGKISKAIATTMSLDENALLKSMLINVDINDSGKIPTSAYIHTLVERIGMSTELGSGANLTAAINALNGNIAGISANFNHFKTYYTTTGASITPDATFLAGLQEIYNGIPDNCVFVLFSAFSGTLVHLDGLKASSQYGTITASSYASAANKRYDILAGTWTLK